MTSEHVWGQWLKPYLRRDVNNWVSLQVGAGQVSAVTQANGATTTVSTPFSLASMAFLRIRESAGTTYFEVSPTGAAYTPIHSVADPIPLDSVTVWLQGEASVAQLANRTIEFDNVNYP